ncbi:MAG: 1-(5-phosphoribosyl)-5-[(5-phosphoribosylamino)methylideneamino] imidazole-4-carboxamide isomerase [Longimicrobiales bacterium]|nr:1-(5-phosphoribosyl)-5-[(5-phosphoribosylamino)methylideneamino] imidazole-4-carboxamide isomerase [Longimicrobiales bacterium]
MIAIPAVDLRGGRCVQLVGGRPEDERVSLPDPPAVAEEWWETGFRSLHVVDLDAALGGGDNRDTIRSVLDRTDATVQVGGGVRSTDDVAWLVEAGADRVVVGTRAVKDPEWLGDVTESFPDRIVVAADVRDGEVLVRGWTEGSGLRIADLLERLASLPLAGVLCTDVGREGRMEGIDRKGVRSVVEGTDHRVWISGGITSVDELTFLREVGAAGAVLGMALYTDVLDGETVAKEFGA